MRCINCSSIDIGKIGPKQYYCWDCCIEMTIDGDKIDVYQVEKDGTVSSLNDLFFEEAVVVEEGSDAHGNGLPMASGG
ncbi:hypothetical protein D3C84_995080 [compost metagenome]